MSVIAFRKVLQLSYNLYCIGYTKVDTKISSCGKIITHTNGAYT